MEGNPGMRNTTEIPIQNVDREIFEAAIARSKKIAHGRLDLVGFRVDGGLVWYCVSFIDMADLFFLGTLAERIKNESTIATIRRTVNEDLAKILTPGLN
jgi:hypothetical protein